MKKILIPLLAMLCILALLPLRREETKLAEHEMYLKNHEFYFITFYDKNDSTFLERIYTIIDQEYEDFHLYLSITKEEKSIIANIQTYAKKRSKEHILNILECADETPMQDIKESIFKKLPPNSVVVELQKGCFFSENTTLLCLNNAFKESLSPICLYSNYTLAPSYTTNKQKVQFANAKLTATYASDLQSKNLSSAYFLDEPLVTYQKSKLWNTSHLPKDPKCILH